MDMIHKYTHRHINTYSKYIGFGPGGGDKEAKVIDQLLESM